MDCFCGGMSVTKNRKCDTDLKGLKDKVRFLQDEVKSIINEREKESRVYEKDMMVFAFKEAEWKQEKKRLKEEVKKLKKTVEEKEEKIKGMEDCGFSVEKNVGKDGWQVMGTTTTTTITSSLLAEQMKEERALRDEAVDKWKKLYLAIKTELDDLIQRTHRGDGLYWRIEEEEIIDELKLEVKRKEETIQELKARLASVEHDDYKKAIEIDILRQSLRIMTSRNVPSFTLGKPKLALVRRAKKTYRCH